MKWKEILAAPVPAQPKGRGKKYLRAQIADVYLILDLWQDGKYKCRHAMNIQTGEPGSYYPESGAKTAETLNSAAEGHGWYWGSEVSDKEWNLSQKDADTICAVTDVGYSRQTLGRITGKEVEYGRDRRDRIRNSRQMRLNELMSHCPEPGKIVRDWVVSEAVRELQYAFYDRIKKTYHCTACNRDFGGSDTGLKKIKDRETVKCPLCGSSLTVMKRKAEVCTKTRLYIIHNIDDRRGVLRHFEVEIVWSDTRKVYFDECIRLMLQRGMKDCCTIYYNDGWGEWSKGNRANRRWKPGYLYPDTDGIRAGLDGTVYQIWADVFPYLAAAGVKANYNGFLI